MYRWPRSAEHCARPRQGAPKTLFRSKTQSQLLLRMVEAWRPALKRSFLSSRRALKRWSAKVMLNSHLDANRWIFSLQQRYCADIQAESMVEWQSVKIHAYIYSRCDWVIAFLPHWSKSAEMWHSMLLRLFVYLQCMLSIPCHDPHGGFLPYQRLSESKPFTGSKCIEGASLLPHSYPNCIGFFHWLFPLCSGCIRVLPILARPHFQIRADFYRPSQLKSSHTSHNICFWVCHRDARPVSRVAESELQTRRCHEPSAVRHPHERCSQQEWCWTIRGIM